jgi:hypothetical protein
MTKPIVGQHYFNSVCGSMCLYVVEEILPIKLNDEWYEDGLVIYRDFNGVRLSRLTSDFILFFEEYQQ